MAHDNCSKICLDKGDHYRASRKWDVVVELISKNPIYRYREHLIVSRGETKIYEHGEYELATRFDFDTYERFKECCPHLAGRTSEREFYDFVNGKSESPYISYEEFDDLHFTIIPKNPEDCEPMHDVGEQVSEDSVNHPSHYETGKYECIEVMEEALGRETVEDFCMANAFKYLYRSKRKNGLEDVEKANWYLNRYIRMVNEDINNDEK